MKSSNFKFILLLGLFTLAMHMGYSQVYKLKSSSVAFKYKSTDDEWTNWSDWEETSVIVVLDTENDRIKIFSKEPQIYDVIEDEGEKTDEDGDDIWSLYCVNEDGLTCRVRLVQLNSQEGRLQLYVDFNDMSWAYNVYVI